MQEAQLLSERRTFIICKARIYHLQGREQNLAPRRTKSHAAGNKTFSKAWKYISKAWKYILKALKYISKALK